MVREGDWFGLYRAGWQGAVVPEAFSHPAKFARGLIRKIYDYALERGYLKEGDTVLDPFAGVALGGIDAMVHSLHWVGCELEDKFVQLGQQNIDLWNRRYGNGMLRRWGTAVILQGDSRNLVEVLEGARAEGIVASPPFAQAQSGGGIAKTGTPAMQSTGGGPSGTGGYRADMHGIDPANLGNMPTGEPPQCVLSSPPYAQALSGQSNQTDGDREHTIAIGRDPDSAGAGYPRHYGNSDGQLAALPEGEPPQVDGLVASPPWESNLCRDGRGTNLKIHDQLEEKYHRRYGERSFPKETYGNSNGQLGTESGATFWSAAKTILLQCHAILAPGGVAIWVLKDFIRAKKRVDFTGQWRALCESCGFETIEVIKAWLVEERETKLELFTADTSATMHTLDGESERVEGEKFEEGKERRKVVERKSFFRRLYEFNARAAKFWESMGRDDKAGYLWHAHGELWQNYHEQMLDDTRESPPPLPTRTRILRAAQALAYREAGEPDIEIDTQIDYEIVLITQKI